MIIAIESASTDSSVAIAELGGGPIAVDGWSGGLGQGRELLPRLLALLERQDRSLHEAGAIAVGIGPGSFTGLRVGMSLAKGLAHGLHVPIIGVASLQAWLLAEPEARAALARAGAHDAFVLARGADAPVLAAESDLPAALRTEPVAAPAELSAAFGLVEGRPPIRAAASVATIAAERLRERPDGDALATLEPAYLRLPRGVDRLPAAKIQWQ